MQASEREGAVARLMHAAPYLVGRRILWVDDRPEWNVDAAELFRMAGMTVDVATWTREANRRHKRL